MAAKVDFKRELTEFYAARRSPAVVEAPELAFLMIDGHGGPNISGEYRDAVSALFSVSYAARFALKRAGVIDHPSADALTRVVPVAEPSTGHTHSPQRHTTTVGFRSPLHT